MTTDEGRGAAMWKRFLDWYDAHPEQFRDLCRETVAMVRDDGFADRGGVFHVMRKLGRRVQDEGAYKVNNDLYPAFARLCVSEWPVELECRRSLLDAAYPDGLPATDEMREDMRRAWLEVMG